MNVNTMIINLIVYTYVPMSPELFSSNSINCSVRLILNNHTYYNAHTYIHKGLYLYTYYITQHKIRTKESSDTC